MASMARTRAERDRAWADPCHALPAGAVHMIKSKPLPDVRPSLSDDHCDERNFVWKEVLQPIVQLLPATYMAEAWL